MLLAAGLRVGIFTSVFGSRLSRSILVSFIQPFVFFIAFVPLSVYGALEASYGGLGFGAVLFLLGVVWTIVADRSGRPDIHSTFGLLQAFLAASTENRVDKIEGFTEARAQDREIQTRVIKFLPAGNASGGDSVAIVLPDLHPGPFGAVGGSDLPYVLYQVFSKRALVMHSVSDHSLNIPSKRELDKYVSSLSGLNVVRKGDTCSEPVQVNVGRATTTGIALGDTALVMLSLAPVGMEDVAKETRVELESYGAGLGFDSVLVIDCHNAMGKHLTEADQRDLIQSAKQCLERLTNGPQKKFCVGFATLEDGDKALSGASELGRAGIAVLAIRVGKRQYAIGWADSNNMDNRLREAILSRPGSDVSMLEVCTSDTHSTSGKKTKEGYFALGTLTSPETIARAFAEISRKAADRAREDSRFQLASASSRIRVMGEKQFEEYSFALDRSMNVTKFFVAITAATYVAMLVLA
jgi:putative membrane protein